jgi:hypothetical protein
MNVRPVACAMIMLGAYLLAACGGRSPSTSAERTGSVEKIDRVGQAFTIATPLTLRLTSLTMPITSGAPDSQVNVWVTLPGLASTRVFLGYFAPQGVFDPNTDFNCSSQINLSESNGYCTASLPLHTTQLSTKFTGTLPANTGGSASVQLNNTTAHFTIDDQGNPSQTCLTAPVDTDLLTVCWEVSPAVPFTAPPQLETVFYLPPGEESSIGLQQSNTISVRTGWSDQFGSTIAFNVSTGVFSGGLSFQSSSTIGGGTTISTTNSSGYAVNSTTMLPDPNNNLYHIIVGANATWTDLHDGNPPTVSTDLSSGHLETLTFGQLKGLAQTPQDVSTIPSAEQGIVTTYITPDVAQQYVAQDPFSSNEDISQHPERFVPAVPAQLQLQRRACASCGDPSTTATDAKANGSDSFLNASVGFSLKFEISKADSSSLTINDTYTNTASYSNTTQSSATITLKTHSLCVEGAVDLYLDKAFGSIITVPHLEDSCNAPSSCGVLSSGQSLVPGQSLTSCNGLFTLSMQPDGTLIEFYNPDGSQPTNFGTTGATVAVMQTDGNFVVYDANSNQLMSSGTSSSAGAYLIVQDDGFIDIYNPLYNPFTGGTGGQIPPLWFSAPGG